MLLHPVPFFHAVQGGEALNQTLFAPTHLTFLEFAAASYVRDRLGEFSSQTRNAGQPTAVARRGAQAHMLDDVNSTVAQMLSHAEASQSEVLTVNLKLYADCIGMLAASEHAIRCSMHESASPTTRSSAPKASSATTAALRTGVFDPASANSNNGNGLLSLTAFRATAEAPVFSIRAHVTNAFLQVARGSLSARLQSLVFSANGALRQQVFGHSVTLQSEPVG